MHEVDDETIQKYAKLMKDYNLSGIEITQGDTSVRLEQQTTPAQQEVIHLAQNMSDIAAAQISAATSGAFPAVAGANASFPAIQAAPMPAQAASSDASTNTAATTNTNRIIDVKSPIVGVFYAAPTENSRPYVKVGDTVKCGDTLCIVEAMKLMNEITAEQDGVISEICVQNAQVVEHGSVLFKIEV